MVGIPQVNSTDAVGVPPTSSEDIPSRVAIIGAAYQGTLNALFRVQTNPILTDHVVGPMVRSSKHVLANTRIPLITVRAEASNPGAYDAIDNTGKTGTALPAVDASVIPRDEYEGYWVIVDGGILGTAGITYYESTDGGRTLSGLKKLGTAALFQFPTEGIRVNLNPPAGALVALATELRADLLGHFADAVAHNSADAIAAALITLAAPTTNALAIPAANEYRAAFESHRLNTTAHDSKDLLNAMVAPVATTEHGAWLILVELKAKLNVHNAATYPAAAASLLALTASSVAVQVYDASDLIAAGVTQVNNYPSFITFTTDAAGTPADAPATATIAGTNADTLIADTDIVNISQVAGTATAVKRFVIDDDFSITYSAGDGAGALISIGASAAAHNSADVTNVVTTADPSPGTLLTDDVIRSQTFAPYPSVDELAAAFSKLALSSLTPGIVVLPGRTPASYGPTITAGLDLMKENGKPVECIIQGRRATSLETQQQLRDALELEWDDTDKRLMVCATDALCTLTEGSATLNVAKQRFTGFASNFTVRRVINPFFETTWRVQPALEGVTLVNSDGVLVGHDEPRNVPTRLQLLYRVPDSQQGRPTVPSIDYALAGEEDREITQRANLIRDEIERVFNSWAWSQIGTLAAVTVLTPTTGRLNEGKRQDLQRNAAAALANRAGLAAGVSDINAPDLVAVDPFVTLNGDLVTISAVINWTPIGAIERIDSTLSARTGS